MTVAIERSQSWVSALKLVRERGYQRRDEPFRLASGQWSHDYIDGKYAIDSASVCGLLVLPLRCWQSHATSGMTPLVDSAWGQTL